MKITTRRVLLVFALVLVAFAGLLLYQNFGPDPPINLSQQTTWLTEPLAGDGFPDYVAYLLEQRPEVKPDANAAIPLVQALWPADISAKHQRQMCEAMGMPMPVVDGICRPDSDSRQDDSVHRSVMLTLLMQHGIEPPGPITNQRDFEAWRESWNDVDDSGDEGDLFDRDAFAGAFDGAELSPEEQLADRWDSDPFYQADEAAFELIWTCEEYPWTKQQMPAVAGWIERQAGHFELLHEAASRSQFYLPSSSQIEGTPAMVISQLTPLAGLSRDAITVLEIRALNYLGSGDHASAWRDIEAAYRIADFKQSESLISQLVSIGCQASSADAALQLFDDPELSAAVAERAFDFYQSRPSMGNLWQVIDKYERMTLLDLAAGASGQRALPPDVAASVSEWFTVLTIDTEGDEPAEFDVAGYSIDWNVVLATINKWCDRYVDAAKITDTQSRRAKFDELDTQLAEFELLKPNDVALWMLRGYRSEMLANQFCDFILSTLSSASFATDRHNGQLVLMQTAAAIALYRVRSGDHPASLDELVPEILPAVPTDNFRGNPLAYTKLDDGYLLVNLGPNGIDDGGSHYRMGIYQGISTDDEDQARECLGLAPFDSDNPEPIDNKIPEGADDLAIRMPRMRANWSLLDPPKRKL